MADENQVEILKEMLELSIKAGRRMYHDYKHMLSEISPDNHFYDEFKERGKIWRSIFYPDNGMKDYRSELHMTIIRLENSLSVANKKLKEHGIDYEDGLPF